MLAGAVEFEQVDGVEVHRCVEIGNALSLRYSDALPQEDVSVAVCISRAVPDNVLVVNYSSMNNSLDDSNTLADDKESAVGCLGSVQQSDRI